MARAERAAVRVRVLLVALVVAVGGLAAVALWLRQPGEERVRSAAPRPPTSGDGVPAKRQAIAATTPGAPTGRERERDRGTPAEPPVEPKREETQGRAEAIQNGFFFSEGQHVPPPYRVTVVDNQVRVNGTHTVYQAPRPKRPLVGGPKDPGEFEWTEAKRKQRLAASGFAEHASKKLEYWTVAHGFPKAWQMFVEYYKAQPTVKEIRVEGEASLGVLDIFGDAYGTGWKGGRGSFQAAIKRKYAASEQEAVRRYEQAAAAANAALEGERERYEHRLAAGRAIFSLSANGGAVVTMGSRSTATALPAIGDILRSKATKREKLDALRRFHPDPRFGAQLVARHDGHWPVGGPAEPNDP